MNEEQERQLSAVPHTLEDTLQFARDSTLTIIEIMQAAEDEAAALFRGLPGGEISHPQQDDDERRRQVLKEIQYLLRTFVALARDDDFGDLRDLQDIMTAAISNLSQRFPDLSRLESLTLAELMDLLEDLRRQAELLSLLHSAYVLSGKQGGFPGWEWAGLPFEQLQALLDRSQAHLTNSPWGDWLSDALGVSLWMFPSGRSLDKDDWRFPFATVFHAALEQFLEQSTPAEQIAFLMGLQQMIRDDPEHYGHFVVGEVPQLGIPAVMNLLTQLKQAAEQMREKVEQDQVLANELRHNKVIADTSPDDLAQLLALMRLTFYAPKGGGGGSPSSRYGTAGEVADLNGKTFADVDSLLRSQTRFKGAHETNGGYIHYRFDEGLSPDGRPITSEIILKPNGEVVRIPKPIIDPATGQNVTKNFQIDIGSGQLIRPHQVPREKIIR